MVKKTICVFIGSRANYSSIKSALIAIQNHPGLELKIVLGGSALVKKYGNLEKILEALEKTKVRLRANVNFELALELLFLTIRER